MMRRTMPAGVDLIKEYEIYSEVARLDWDGRWKISWGISGPHVSKTTKWTTTQCEEAFEQQLRRIEEDVLVMLMGTRVSDPVFAALVSFTWSIGSGPAARSTLIRKLRAGDRIGAWSELPRHAHFQGALISRLVKRRSAEQDLWMRRV